MMVFFKSSIDWSSFLCLAFLLYTRYIYSYYTIYTYILSEKVSSENFFFWFISSSRTSI